MSRKAIIVLAAVLLIVVAAGVVLFLQQASTFPAEAKSALDANVNYQSYTIVSTKKATNANASPSIYGAPEQLWCVVISPPLDIECDGLGMRGMDHFLIQQRGASWDSNCGAARNDTSTSSDWSRAGCRNWQVTCPNSLWSLRRWLFGIIVHFRRA